MQETSSETNEDSVRVGLLDEQGRITFGFLHDGELEGYGLRWSPRGQMIAFSRFGDPTLVLDFEQAVQLVELPEQREAIAAELRGYRDLPEPEYTESAFELVQPFSERLTQAARDLEEVRERWSRATHEPFQRGALLSFALTARAIAQGCEELAESAPEDPVPVEQKPPPETLAYVPNLEDF